MRPSIALGKLRVFLAPMANRAPIDDASTFAGALAGRLRFPHPSPEQAAFPGGVACFRAFVLFYFSESGMLAVPYYGKGPADGQSAAQLEIQ